MNWKTLKEYIPLLSVLSAGIILFSLIKQCIYYGHFNIQIQDYIEISELFLAFAGQLMLIVVGTAALAIIAVSHWQNRPKIGVIKLIVLGIIIFVFLGMNLNHATDSTYFRYLIPLGFLSMVITISMIRFDSKKAYSIEINIRNLPTFFVIVVFFLLLINITYLEAASTESGQYLGTKIFTKDSTYVSDKNHFYIGKTQNYYFIYNKDSSTLVIPEREVTKFELKTH